MNQAQIKSQSFLPKLPKPRKQFGQHFLTDKNVITKIVDSLKLKSSDVVLEIGPGRGALTSVLLKKLDKLYAIEFDRDLAEMLTQKFSNLRLFTLDALKFDYNKVINIHSSAIHSYKLIGNLPYNISTPLLFSFIRQIHCFSDITIMVQREVAQRIMAEVGSDAYGRLSVMAKYFFTSIKVSDVSAGCFYPPPKVRSMVIRLTPRSTEEINRCDKVVLEEIVKAAFANRRKKISNCLKKYFTGLQLNQIGEECHIDKLADLRAENIDIAVYIYMTNTHKKSL